MPWWRVGTRPAQFYHSMAAGTGSKQTYGWTTGPNDALSFETTNRMYLWNPAIWQPSNLWDFFTTKSQTLGPGQFRALAREHVYSSTSAPSTASLAIPALDCSTIDLVS